MKNISRRDFLKGSAAVVGASLVGSLGITAYADDAAADAQAAEGYVIPDHPVDGRYVTRAIGHESWVYVSTLLKDGASQAIFGLRGANGVLVINTRRGTPGKMKLNVNISNTVEQPVDVMHQFDSYDYAVLRNQAAFNDGKGEYFYFSQQTLDNLKSGEDREHYPNTDWSTMLRKASHLQRIALDASGGSERVQYFTTMNVIHQGSFWNTDQDKYKTDNEKVRLNFRSNVDVMVNNWIGLFMNLAGSVVRAHTPYANTSSDATVYEYMAFMPPTVYGPVTPTVLDADGETVLSGDYLFGAISNSTSVGGILTLDPAVVDMNDGLFELLYVKYPRNISELAETIHALTAQDYSSPRLVFRSAKRVQIHARPEMDWTLDGEYAKGEASIEIENLHSAVQIMMKD
jgi:TonB-dependent SusC/RagA subfamily outer membrane receptor